MAALATKKSVARGTRQKLTDAPITTAGGAGTIDFDVPGSTGADWSMFFQAVGTVTSLSADLQISLDGGVTFNTFSAAFLVAATPFKEIASMIAGALFRINVTAAPTSADIWVCRN